jgi:hypothetical protein
VGGVTHPNNMTAWPEIACQRGHETHASRTVAVNLANPHAYHDYPLVPARLARSFAMRVFDWQRYDSDGPYCPGRDVVSQTITELGIWEPAETILTLYVCETAGKGAAFMDLGAQIGWYSLLAASSGLSVYAVDADPEPLQLLADSAEMNGWTITTVTQRLAPEVPEFAPIHLRMAKIDVEGAEDQAIRILRPSFMWGLVDHLLLEVSPVFDSYYPALVADLLGYGYIAYALPEKARPRPVLEDPERDLLRLSTEDLRGIPTWHQRNLWFRQEGASW